MLCESAVVLSCRPKREMATNSVTKASNVGRNAMMANGIGKPIVTNDNLFLETLMETPDINKKPQNSKKAEDDLRYPVPLATGSYNLAVSLRNLCEVSTTAYAEVLHNLLYRPHLLALLKAHDTIADQRYAISGFSWFHQRVPSSNTSASSGQENAVFMPEENGYEVDAVRMVGLRKNPEEPLGLTVREDDSGYLIVARIMAGGTIDRQSLLHVGDAICEVNGIEVTTLDELYKEVNKCTDSVTLKVFPAIKDKVSANQVNSSLPPEATRTICYMRALYSYDPTSDTLLPACPSQEKEEIGLHFSKGDILQIVDQSDPNWWQAQVVGRSPQKTGLVPSQLLEERRKAFVRQEFDFVHKIGICGTMISKRKRKLMFSSKQSNDFDKAELLLYEEVARMPPFMRKTLVLVGSHGVGRRTIKNRIISSDPNKFGSVIPHTSRPMRELEEDGKAYHFTTREAMEADIKAHLYLEYGEFGGNLYGTKLESILSVIRAGKMCVLDPSPSALKFLRNSPDYLPYVIFLAAPGLEELKSVNGNGGRYFGASNKSLTFDRYSSARYSSRRARTLESLASLYEEEDYKRTIEESAKLERQYEKYYDYVIENNDLNDTHDQIMEAIDKLATEPQWVPVTWVY